MFYRRLLISLFFFLLFCTNASQAQERLCDTAFEDCRAPLWQLIDAETQGIDVAFWFMQDSSYATKLINKFKAGVPVRVLVDPRANPTYPGNEDVLNMLRDAGIPMRYKLTDGILHWKMMLFVGQGKLEFSGANYSGNFFVPDSPNVNYIDEGIYFTDDPSLIQSFKTEYDSVWTNTTDYGNYANIAGQLTRNYPTFPIDPELNFPPTADGSQDYLTRTQQRLNAETQKVDIIMYRITNQNYTDTTLATVRRGIPVRLIHEPDEYRNPARQWDSWNVDRMYMGGVQIKMRKHLGLNHQKTVLLYGQGMTIFGSSNWTGPSSNYQQEHNYFTTKSWFFNWFVNQFERKWNSTSENEPFVPLPPTTPSYMSPVNSAIAQPTTLTLQWEGGPWAHKYDIYFGTSPDPPLLVSDVSTVQSGAQPGQPLLDTGSVDDGNPESYTIPVTLQQGTTYYWRIVGKTMANQTASGPTWSFVTMGSTAPPSAPSGLVATPISPTRMDLSWSDVGGETGYRVERSSDGSTGWTEIASLSANQTTYSDTQVAAQQTWFYRTRALNTGGFSPYSNVAHATTPAPAPPSASDVVLWASEAPVRVGAWSVVADASAAGGNRISNPDAGAPKRTVALASPPDYFEMTFNAQAGTDYRIWVRGKAQNDFWGNDSVFIQFSDSVDSTSAPTFRIGTTAAAEMNLEDCSGCGLSGWGWQDDGWGVGVLGPLIRFQTTGTHTLRVQVREDGLSIDQIVFSPQTYITTSPGALKNDTTILPKTTGGGTSSPPSVATVSPTSGSTVGGTAITITGSAFQAGATVSLGGVAATSPVVVNSTTITATTPAHAAGVVDVAVRNPDNQTGTLIQGFTYSNPPPTVTSISPTSGSTTGGTSITVSGTGFQAGATVSLGGVAATNPVVVNSTTITATAPAHAAGTVDISVTNPGNQVTTLAQAFTYTNTQPQVPAFDHVFIVALENESFSAATGGMPFLNTLASRYGLAVNYFANTHPSIGNYFWLTTGQGITDDSNFSGTVSVDNIVRELSLSGKTWRSYAESLPSIGYTGTDQYPYVKRHNPFAYLSDVLNNQAQANNIVPFSQFSIDMANGQLPNYAFIIPNQQNNAHDCPASIPSCTNADKLTAADQWLQNNIDPLIASAAFRQNGLLVITFDESIDTDTQNGGGHVITVVISPKAKPGFQSSTFYQHQSVLRVAGEALGIGTYPGGSANAPDMAEFFSATPNTAPVISSVSPSSGPAGGGTTVTITGSGFASGATVTFGGTAATNVSVLGSTRITAVSPAHSSGQVNVVVTNPNAQSVTSINAYTYSTPQSPSVSSVAPNSGPTAGGTSITISGSGFASGATVTLGGTAATNVVVSNSTTIAATTPPHVSGTVDVVVTNSNGQSGAKLNAFTYNAPAGETILLADDFNDGSLNRSLWQPNNLFSGFTDPNVMLTETQTFAVGPLQQNLDGSHYNGIRSTGTYDFTGAYAYVQLVQAPNALTAADAFYTLGLNVDNCYRMYVESGNLILQKKIGGAKTTLMTVTFNAANHAFWRIRHDAISGQVVFETAPSNAGTPGTWSQAYAESWNTSAVPLSTVTFELKGGTWRVEGNNPGTVIFDNFKAAKP
jgi:phosphoesterase family protein/IPT/TIG domain-containing protein/phospholipase D-like protein